MQTEGQIEIESFFLLFLISHSLLLGTFDSGEVTSVTQITMTKVFHGFGRAIYELLLFSTAKVPATPASFLFLLRCQMNGI